MVQILQIGKSVIYAIVKDQSRKSQRRLGSHTAIPLPFEYLQKVNIFYARVPDTVVKMYSLPDMSIFN